MLYLILGIELAVLLLLLLGVTNPLANWPSYWRVWGIVIRSRTLKTRTKIRLFTHLVRDLLLSPLHNLLWQVDELIFGRRLNQVDLRPPVFIVSQPRSGSTFLHRTLAVDEETFFAVTYLEYKYPYICIWWLIDHLGLRRWLNRRSYWSRSGAGLTASKMHPHLYGDHEEHGVFLEEKFYHHYFVFRRFPHVDILEHNTDFYSLTREQQVRLLSVFVRTIHKVAHYRGGGRVWLTKENESVSFYESLLSIYPDAVLLFLVRDHEDMLASYVALSRMSTLAKTGVDIGIVEELDLYRANLRFRRLECTSFCDFHNEVGDANVRAVLLNYDALVRDIPNSVERIYNLMGLVPGFWFQLYLGSLMREQLYRVRTYETSRLTPEDRSGFETFAELVKKSTRENHYARRTGSKRQ